jgi:hypothetical protein
MLRASGLAGFRFSVGFACIFPFGLTCFLWSGGVFNRRRNSASPFSWSLSLGDSDMVLDRDFYVRSVRRRERELKKHSAQIGRLCTLWSSLEFDIAVFLTVVAPFDDPAVKNVLMGSMDFRSKVHALLAIGFKKKPYDTWYDDLAGAINKIDNELRPERNRMVHDFWYTVPNQSGDEEVNRVQLRPKVVNVQSRTKQLILADMKPLPATEIAALCESIISAHADLLVLRHAFEIDPLQNRLLPPFGHPSPTRGGTK